MASISHCSTTSHKVLRDNKRPTFSGVSLLLSLGKKRVRVLCRCCRDGKQAAGKHSELSEVARLFLSPLEGVGLGSSTTHSLFEGHTGRILCTLDYTTARSRKGSVSGAVAPIVVIRETPACAWKVSITTLCMWFVMLPAEALARDPLSLTAFLETRDGPAADDAVCRAFGSSCFSRYSCDGDIQRSMRYEAEYPNIFNTRYSEKLFALPIEHGYHGLVWGKAL